MTLPEISEKIKAAPDVSANIFRTILFLLLVLIGYIGGRLYTLEAERKANLRVVAPFGGQEVTMTEKREMGARVLTNIKNSVPDGKQYVASKNGKVFHLPWCPGAKRIKEENKIWFSSKEEALALGLKPAANCDGI